jgi:hypothetical protein
MLLQLISLDAAGNLLALARFKQRQGAQLGTHAFSRSASSPLMPPSGSPRFVTCFTEDPLLSGMRWAAPVGSNPPLPRPPCWARPSGASSLADVSICFRAPLSFTLSKCARQKGHQSGSHHRPPPSRQPLETTAQSPHAQSAEGALPPLPPAPAAALPAARGPLQANK